MISERLKQLRKEKNISQKTISNAIGITLSAYSNYEQGIREPAIEIIIKLCKYFEISADYLLGLEN